MMRVDIRQRYERCGPMVQHRGRGLLRDDEESDDRTRVAAFVDTRFARGLPDTREMAVSGVRAQLRTLEEPMAELREVA